MQDYIYSVIPILAMAIHLIINSGRIAGRGKVNARGACAYRRFLCGVFACYIVDVGWGVLAGLGWTNALYVDTALYYIAIAASVLTWCHFVIVYLDLGKWTARTLSWFGYALLALYMVLVTANVFNNCLFYFDDQGHYGAGPVRLMIFYPLVALNVPLAIFAFLRTLRSKGPLRRRHMAVFLFCLTMMAAVTLQIVWPLWPYYALGCLLGTCFLHIFLVEGERSDLRRTAIEREQLVKHMEELEKALERARAAEKSKSMFFSIVSHDIRTPLNAILGYSELLQKGIESESERNEALHAIHVSGTTLLQLINDVLDLAKLDAGKMPLRPEPLSLTQLMDDVLLSFRVAAKNKGIALVNRTADMPTLLLDEHRFRQILFNLVGNAVKFTERGSVTVAASYVDTNLEVSVSDTGCGIPSDILPRILDPFVQVEEAQHSADRVIGTGLGLSICRSLVEIMGGELRVESELGKGSTFRVCIPGVAASDEKARPATGVKSTLIPKSLPKHVLIVDDSPVNRSVLTAFTKRAGINSVGHAGDGVEAFSELESAAKAGRPYDFVVSDFWMPNMNGLEFIEKLRADPRFGSLPVFALTADTEIHGDNRTRLFTGVLLKPLTYDKLVEAFAAAEKLGL